jgi:short subunit fatty acids transporter
MIIIELIFSSKDQWQNGLTSSAPLMLANPHSSTSSKQEVSPKEGDPA